MSILWGVIPGLCCRWDSFQHSHQYHCNMHVPNQEDSFYHGRFRRIYRRTKNEYWRWRWPLWAEPKCNILVCPPPPNLQLVNTMMRTTTNLEMMMMLISRLQIYSWIKVHICISTSKDSGKRGWKKLSSDEWCYIILKWMDWIGGISRRFEENIEMVCPKLRSALSPLILCSGEVSGNSGLKNFLKMLQ